MDEFVALAVLLGAFYLIAPIVALVMAMGQSGRVAKLAAENASLKVRVDNLERRAVHQAAPAAETPAATVPDQVVTPPEPVSQQGEAAPLPPENAEPEITADDTPQQGHTGWTAAANTPPAVTTPRPPFDWERFIGVRLPVWLGALALSLAGFFFVRYSIEAGLLTPAFRVFAALLAAFGFLLGAEFVRRRVKVDNGPAIAAALAAAGVATLFATAYLASVVYELVPITAGFIAMAAATATGIAIALIFGRTVAIVGMLGGYATPALIPSEQPSTAVLFAYLTAILIGMFVIIQRKGWWNIALVALLGPAVWIVAWAALPGFETDHIWGTAFLFAVSATVLVAAYRNWSATEQPISARGRKGEATNPGQAVIAAVALSSLGFVALLLQSGHVLPFWQGLLGFAAVTVALAFIWPVALRHLPLAPLAAAALAMLGWDNGDPATATIIIAAAAIFGFFALDQFRRLRAPVLAAGTAAFVALFFYLMALGKAAGWQEALDQPHLWALGRWRWRWVYWPCCGASARPLPSLSSATASMPSLHPR